MKCDTIIFAFQKDRMNNDAIKDLFPCKGAWKGNPDLSCVLFSLKAMTFSFDDEQLVENRLFLIYFFFWKDSDIILTLNDRYDEHLYVFF